MTRKRAEKQKDNESCEKKKESLQCSTDGPDTEAFSGSGEVCFNGLSRPTRDVGDTSGARRVRMTRFVVLTLFRQEIWKTEGVLFVAWGQERRFAIGRQGHDSTVIGANWFALRLQESHIR